ncbi:hypothetical protein QFZ82_006572 [Streptomyces sp. V4I23]|nr:hypothetical protein [Streptomyces sp. V4I23]
MSHRPARRARPARPARRASAPPLFTPHGTDRASRKQARRQLAEATAKARAEAPPTRQRAHTSSTRRPLPSTPRADAPDPPPPARTG